MPQAVRASISIPGVFPPVQAANGHYLVDGGILDNLPTDVLKHDLHADTVIAVHLQEAAISNPDTSSIVGVLNRAFDAGIESNVTRPSIADVVINVPIGNFSSTDYSKTNAEQLIRAGYKAAEQSRAALLPYALDDQGWKAYVAARDSRRAALPGNLRQVRVQGGVPAARREVLADFKPLQAQPIAAAQTLNALKPIQSNGGLSATYETFAPPPNSAVPNTGNPDTGILVRLTNDPIGPPYLLVGADLAAETSNITLGEINFRLVDQNLGGFGSELRATARLGYMTDLSTEYYRLLTPAGFFLEPRAGILREPVYIWVNQKRVAERFQQNLDAGIEAGRTIGNSVQLSTEWRAEDTRWSLTTGSGGGPYLERNRANRPAPHQYRQGNLRHRLAAGLPSVSLRWRFLPRRRQRQRSARHALHGPHLAVAGAQYLRPHRGHQLLSPRQRRPAIPLHPRRPASALRFVV